MGQEINVAPAESATLERERICHEIMRASDRTRAGSLGSSKGTEHLRNVPRRHEVTSPRRSRTGRVLVAGGAGQILPVADGALLW